MSTATRTAARPATRASFSALRLPMIVAPMFLVSGPDLVISAAKWGVIGAMPTLNARDLDTLERWLMRIRRETSAVRGTFAINLVVHNKYARMQADLDLIVKHEVPYVITSIGSPASVVERVHAYGGRVLSDVATIRHARLAIDAGVDGLILLCAGAGGNTGWLNPFAFVAEIRSFYDGPLAVAGCINSGQALRALEILGADLGYVGTPFIVAEESLASDEYRREVRMAHADDVVLTSAVTGIPSNILNASLTKWSIDPRESAGGFQGIDPAGTSAKPWKEIWSTGQGVGASKATLPASEILGMWESQYQGPRFQLAQGEH